VQKNHIVVPANRHQIIKDSTHFLLATVIGQGIGLIRAIFIPVIFSPAQLGIWNLMNVIMNYGGNAHLGILHGMNKAIPLLRSQNKIEEVGLIKDNVFWLNLFLGFLASTIFWLTSLFVPAGYVFPLQIIAVVVFLQLIFYYLFSLLRADSRFKLVSQGVFAFSILSTVLILLLAIGFTDHLLGALIGMGTAYLLVVVYLFVEGKYRFTFNMELRSIRSAFVFGVPLIIMGFLEAVLLSVDRWIIVWNLGETSLGYYALGIMACTMIALVPGSIASVLYPRMLERHGACDNPFVLRSLFVGPTRALMALMSVLIGASVLILPFLIRFFLPKYIPSVTVSSILLAAAFFYSSSFIPGSFLVSINKQKHLIQIQVAMILLALILDLAVIYIGWGIVGIAWSTAAVYTGYGCGCLFLAAYYGFEKRSDIVWFFTETFAIFLVMIAGLALSIFIIFEGSTLATASLSVGFRLALFSLVLFPVLWWFNRNGELLAIVREVLINR
jgi:O-antigen/teichoic acid export membrane protein